MKKTFTLLLSIFTFAAYCQSNCLQALAVGPGNYTITEINGEPTTTSCFSNGNGSLVAWYKYIPTANFTTVISTDLQVNICKDTRIQLFSGTCGSLSCIDGDDDAGIIQCDNGQNNDSYLSKITFNAVAGNTYYIAFDNYYYNGEPFGHDFSITETPVVEPDPTPITFTTTQIPITNGGYNECVVDLNGDNLDDIMGFRNNSLQVFYQNTTGGFTETIIQTPNIAFDPSWSTAAGDYNRDGFNDLLFGDVNGVSFLRSNSSGTGFTHFSTPDYVFSQRSNFVDLNNDGHLDAFVCHDVAPNVFYINDGEGNLTFNQGGIGNYPSGGHYGSVWTDYDNDGDIDMFMAKCGGEPARRVNELFRNNGDGTYTNVATEAGLADPVQTWSAAVADYDNDGDMDILVGCSSFGEAGGHKFMRNNNDGTFSNVSVGSGWDTNTSTSIEFAPYDFDNDGFVDVLSQGVLNNQTVLKIMFNDGDMTFTPHLFPNTSYGPVGDLNNDGFLDIQNRGNLRINNGNDNNWLKLTFNGVESNKNGIGARIEVYGSWGKQIREVRSGEGFALMSSLNVHFGLGTASTIDQVVVRWPSGTVDTFNNVSVNQVLNVVEGATLSNQDIRNNVFAIYPNPVKETINIQLKDSAMTLANAQVFDIKGKRVINTNDVSQPINVSQLANGSYIMVVSDDARNSYSQKFIKE